MSFHIQHQFPLQLESSYRHSTHIFFPQAIYVCPLCKLFWFVAAFEGLNDLKTHLMETADDKMIWINWLLSKYYFVVR